MKLLERDICLGGVHFNVSGCRSHEEHNGLRIVVFAWAQTAGDGLSDKAVRNDGERERLRGQTGKTECPVAVRDLRLGYGIACTCQRERYAHPLVQLAILTGNN